MIHFRGFLTIEPYPLLICTSPSDSRAFPEAQDSDDSGGPRLDEDQIQKNLDGLIKARHEAASSVGESSEENLQKNNTFQ